MSPTFSGYFASKIVTKNFQKSPNLVTLMILDISNVSERTGKNAKASLVRPDLAKISFWPLFVGCIHF